MDVPKKIKFLNKIKRIFPEWALAKQGEVIYQSFSEGMKKALDWERQKYIESLRDFEAGEYWDELSRLQSLKLLKLARKLHIATTGMKWESGQSGVKYLDERSDTNLQRAIREETRKTWEFRIRVIVAITGLKGAVTGLIAVFNATGHQK